LKEEGRKFLARQVDLPYALLSRLPLVLSYLGVGLGRDGDHGRGCGRGLELGLAATRIDTSRWKWRIQDGWQQKISEINGTIVSQ
jgi:hypothetical protein